MVVQLLATVLVLLMATAAAHDRPASGVIHGLVIGQDGQPAKNIGVTASPLGVALATVLPHTKTNDAGEYRLKAPWWGRYTVYAEDEDAGYSTFSTGPSGRPHPPEVEITPEHPEAEFNFRLPPKAGFLEIHLSSRQTGDKITTMSVRLMNA